MTVSRTLQWETLIKCVKIFNCVFNQEYTRKDLQKTGEEKVLLRCHIEGEDLLQSFTYDSCGKHISEDFNFEQSYSNF